MIMNRILGVSFLLLFFTSLSSASYVTPEMFGAKCDGINDDTYAFELAIKTGKNIRLNGVYLISGIRLLGKQMIIGNKGSRIIYNSIILSEGCSLKNLELDGGWNTLGVSIVGNNVLIDGCSFINTKNATKEYGGLTSALWIGHYSDLNTSAIKYNNIKIRNCIFDGCEPYDTISNIDVNNTVARCILSYGCNNLKVKGCVFKNLKGFHDSDYIQLRSYEKSSMEYPFYDNSPEKEGPSSPFYGYCYSDAKTLIKDCVFFQNDCKSSIKIMSSSVRVDNNKFIINNSTLSNKTYSVVRMHITRDVAVKNNEFLVICGNLDNIIKIGNSLDVLVTDNKVTCIKGSHIDSFLDISYSKNSYINFNFFETFSAASLLNTEYNRLVRIKKNTFKMNNYDLDNIDIFMQHPNHYSYPSMVKGVTFFENNKIIISTNKTPTIRTSNNYDYDADYHNNKITTSGR